MKVFRIGMLYSGRDSGEALDCVLASTLILVDMILVDIPVTVIDCRDPDYVPASTMVFVDGVEQPFCYRALRFIDGMGLCYRYARDSGGYILTDDRADVVREVVAGRLDIVQMAYPLG